MVNNPGSKQIVRAILVIVLIMGGSLTALGSSENSAIRALAGQMCPNGSYVIGFDSAGNIVCSEISGNDVINSGKACEDGNTESGDDCAAASQPGVETGIDEAEIAAETRAGETSAGETSAGETSAGETSALETNATDPGILPSLPGPVISDIEPSSVVFGTSEVEITVFGTGFHEESVIIFDGSTYKPVVNQTGTRLNITIETADLVIGSYGIKVSNGPGLEDIQKKAIAVF